jgi:hypothetical protein
MAVIQNYLPPQDVLLADHIAILTINELPGYAPHNSDDGAAALMALDAAFTQIEQEVRQLHNAYEAGRTRLIAAAWVRHNAVLSAKQQVIAQYGDDSSEVQAIGLKRKSERKRPTRRNGAPA